LTCECFVTDRLRKKIQASLLMHIKVRHCIGVKP
jgi:hypothetical protein